MWVVTNAIEKMPSNHEPHLALLIDRYWNVIRTNAAANAFFGSMIDLEAFPKTRNLLELTFDPAGLRPHIESWETFASGLLHRVRREALRLVVDARPQSYWTGSRRTPAQIICRRAA